MVADYLEMMALFFGFYRKIPLRVWIAQAELKSQILPPTASLLTFPT
jgi:hypothetical protein